MIIFVYELLYGRLSFYLFQFLSIIEKDGIHVLLLAFKFQNSDLYCHDQFFIDLARTLEIVTFLTFLITLGRFLVVDCIMFLHSTKKGLANSRCIALLSLRSNNVPINVCFTKS